jgi:hypothetical protein
VDDLPLRQETLQPGETRTIDDLYDDQGNPVRVRIVAMSCPPAAPPSQPPGPGGGGTTAGGPIWIETSNDPPVRANIVRLLYEDHLQPRLGRVWVTGDRDTIAIRSGSGPAFSERADPGEGWVMQSATLVPIGDSDRFEVRLGEDAPDAAGKALLMFLPETQAD